MSMRLKCVQKWIPQKSQQQHQHQERHAGNIAPVLSRNPCKSKEFNGSSAEISIIHDSNQNL